MRNRLLPGVTEATRLTRAGRLGEALALIQSTLGGRPAPATDGEPREAPPHGREAPRLAGPAAGAAGTPAAGPARAAPDPLAAGLPEGLRDLVRQVGRTLGPALDDWLKPEPAPAGKVAPGAGRFLSARFANAAGERAYRLYVPGRYRGRPVPLVVMLHGCTQSPEDFAAGTGMNHLAEAETFLVAYPAQAAAANHARCWNWFSTADQGRDRGEAALVAGLTRAVMEAYAVDPRRVYVAGLSAGGAAAANLAAAYPDLYAAVGVHSGLCAGAAHDLPSALAAMRQGAAGPRAQGAAIPTIVFHGDQDTTVHPRNGAHLIAATGGAPLREEAGQAPGGHAWRRSLFGDAAGRPAFEHWVIQGSGHAWSGGDAAGSYTDPRGPDASREMWRFFAEHPREG
ncbi:hypothetical protein OPKNFCMD_3926 [Methylobacterium crusticola]|uniref:PHB depolymerase family esterase n=1 Tax=Methylobacterium crusticola TaxID=1697972 RepID=A0ABQ4R1Z4_9HYPH|nr:PHB depolymerase family esterase [Methylobacterium crusticola]GJD51174.1 hypothetical protein OPKNFCMD_3926 [Methylobacterium crusticola]